MTRVRPCRISLFAVAALVLVTAALPLFAQSGVSYIYDQLGRLVGVIDPSGNTAAYSYDAVGNLLAITRYSSTQISLINFSPVKGPVGTTVTISGSGFSTTISQDTVKFNGTTATVSSASTNSLVVTVPTGTSPGQIQVTSPAGTATSSGNFTVTADSGAPTITSFSPTVATHGTSITVTGTNINTTPANNILSLNITPQPVSSATSTSLNVTVPVPTASGRITLSTPGGTAVSSQDLYIPFGTHVASDVGVAERTTIGTAATVSISTAWKIGLVIFDGTAGQKVDLSKASLSGLSSCDLYLFAPNGSQILHDGDCSNNHYPLPVTLPANGTYTVGVEPSGTTGSITITVNNLADATGTITAGGSAVTVTTTLPGQDARLTFTGTIGQQVYVKISNVTTTDAFVYLVRPDGSYQGQSSGIAGMDQTNASVEIGPTSSGQFYYLDTTILEMSGTYTLWVQHSQYYYGSEQLYVGNAPTPVTGTIGIGGSPVTVTTTSSWQTAELTFTGTAGQLVFMQETDISTANGYVNLVAPDGTVIEWVGFESGSGYLYCLTSEPLPMSGTYTWWVQNDGTDTGSETLALINMPSSSGTISAGGPAVTVTTTTAGQDELLTFGGAAGQRFFLTITTVSTQDAFVYMINQGSDDVTANNLLGAVEINPISGPGYWYYISPDPLTDTGWYEILIQHVGSYTGSETLQLYNVTTDVTGTITAGGSAVTATMSSPGQDARITFSGTAGERVYLLLTDTSLEDAYVNLLAPDGTNLGWLWTDSDYQSSYQFLVGDTVAVTLPVSGTYTWWIQNYSPTTGSEALQMYDVPADVTGTITVGGSPVTVTTTAVGQSGLLTFSASAGQQVTTTISSVTNPIALVVLMDSSGNFYDYALICSIYCGSTITMGPDTLPSTGTYTLWIIPSGTYFGSETLQLN
jgi:YD repeat-containing protein